MVPHNSLYNIDPFYGNRLLDIKVKALNIIAFFKKIFSVKSFKTGLVNSLNDDFGKFLIITEGIIKVIPELDKIQVEKYYPSVSKSLKHFLKLYASLERIRFLDDEVLRETSDSILTNIYTIEAALRHINFDDNFNNGSNGDSELNKAATLISLNSVLTS